MRVQQGGHQSRVLAAEQCPPPGLPHLRAGAPRSNDKRMLLEELFGVVSA